MGADGWAFLDTDRTYVLTGWGSLSRVTGSRERMVALQRSSARYFQRPDAHAFSVDSTATSLTGYAGRIMLNKQRGAVMLNVAAGVIDPRYEVNDLGYLSRSDVVNAHLASGYRWLTPTSLYRNINISGALFSAWDFDGNQTTKGAWTDAYIMFSNYYFCDVSAIYAGRSIDNRLTRGGPLTVSPHSFTTSLTLGTDNRQWWVITGATERERGPAGTGQSYSLDLQLKLSSNVSINVQPEYEKSSRTMQWVSSYEDPTASTFGRRYLLATLDQEIFEANVRLNWILTPTLSVQFYVQPLIASGAYSDFKFLARPRTLDLTTYGTNGSSISEETNPDGSRSYTIDADGGGPALSYRTADPDFNFVSLRGNAVLRWEFLPGSAMYLVWTQSRSAAESIGDFQLGHSMERLWDLTPDNIFMMKVSYWLNV